MVTLIEQVRSKSYKSVYLYKKSNICALFELYAESVYFINSIFFSYVAPTNNKYLILNRNDRLITIMKQMVFSLMGSAI